MSAQWPHEAEVRRTIEDWRAAWRVPGVAVAVVREGDVLLQQSPTQPWRLVMKPDPRVTCIFVLLAFSPASAQTLTADVDAINRVREDLRQLTRDGDVPGAMRLFTEDAIYLRPGDAADVGREAIRRHWQEGVDAMITDIDWRSEEIEVSGDLAFPRGSLTFRGTPRAGGDQVVNEQRYIWILRRHPQDGWQIARYMRQSAPRS